MTGDDTLEEVDGFRLQQRALVAGQQLQSTHVMSTLLPMARTIAYMHVATYDAALQIM